MPKRKQHRPLVSRFTAGRGSHIRTLVTVRSAYDPTKSGEQLRAIFEASVRRAVARGIKPSVATWYFGGFVWDNNVNDWRTTPPAQPVFSDSARAPEVALREAISRTKANDPTFLAWGGELPARHTEPPVGMRGSDPVAIIATYVVFTFRSAEGIELPDSGGSSKSELVRRAYRAGATDTAESLAEKYGLKPATVRALRREVSRERTPGGGYRRAPKRIPPAEQPIATASKSELIRRDMLHYLKRNGAIDSKAMAQIHHIPEPMARRLKQEALKRAKKG